MRGNKNEGNKTVINEKDKIQLDFSIIMELTPQERAELLKMWKETH